MECEYIVWWNYVQVFSDGNNGRHIILVPSPVFKIEKTWGFMFLVGIACKGVFSKSGVDPRNLRSENQFLEKIRWKRNKSKFKDNVLQQTYKIKLITLSRISQGICKADERLIFSFWSGKWLIL